MGEPSISAGKVLDSWSRGRRSKSHLRHGVVFFSYTLYLQRFNPGKCLDMTKIMLTGIVNFDQEYSGSVVREFDLELKGC